jgi:Response regulator containing CheY-like receiver domain and AraC-type DNA-binding domain
MLKLLLVDDEEFICKSIASLIDWNSYGISLIGICFDGVEAYHMILDEAPNIVMTDVRMPGINGLELIERISKMDLSTKFIILSGYSEFEYAKTAMKYGVKHYLLKPGDINQITECLLDVIKDFETLNPITEPLKFDIEKSKIQKSLVYNVIKEGISAQSIDNNFFRQYTHYLNIDTGSYQFCYFYYLPEYNLNMMLKSIDTFFQTKMPTINLYKIYISNIFLLFFPSFETDYDDLDCYMHNLFSDNNNVDIYYKRISYPNLHTLLSVQIPKLKRFDTLRFIDDSAIQIYSNYHFINSKTEKLIPLLLDDKTTIDDKLTNIHLILESITNHSFLIQLVDYLLISISIKVSNTLTDITSSLYDLHNLSNIEEIRSRTIYKIEELLKLYHSTAKYSPFIEKLLLYTNENYSNPYLTLKNICENHLYMNVNYISRCFPKEVGCKYSAYLLKLRVEKSISLLHENRHLKIQEVAVLVGCGNNPNYFSRIFKKHTGMTATAYVNSLFKS